jgi:hypothetical protein
MSSLHESTVEYGTKDHLQTLGIAIKPGVEIDDAGLLARYGYPPDLAEDATQLVLRQAEVSTDSLD